MSIRACTYLGSFLAASSIRQIIDGNASPTWPMMICREALAGPVVAVTRIFHRLWGALRMQIDGANDKIAAAVTVHPTRLVSNPPD
jgi:hypothetical protein